MMLKGLPSSRTPAKWPGCEKSRIGFYTISWSRWTVVTPRHGTYFVIAGETSQIRSKGKYVCCVSIPHPSISAYLCLRSPAQEAENPPEPLQDAALAHHCHCHYESNSEMSADHLSCFGARSWSPESLKLRVALWLVYPFPGGTPHPDGCLPIPHWGLEEPCCSKVLYCKGCTMTKCYRRASYWEQHALPSICLQFTRVPAPDGAGMRQTASWLCWNIPL